jgi:type II secretory ATPase GspE/PulE/Tfp pilus assembly ATPase PilB-like protein
MEIVYSRNRQGLPLPELDALGQEITALAQADESGVPPLVDAILRGAATLGASDVHIESRRDDVSVRYRVDGQLIPVTAIPKRLGDCVFARLKLMSKVVTYRKRSPQDGRVADDAGGALRAAFMPTLHGEKVVLRLPGSSAPLQLDELGLPSEDLARLRQVLDRSHGTIFFTGPCSSGKSTSIYASLRYLLANSGLPPNIATLEDPIEQEIEGINQTQVDTAGGLTFLSGLRTLLRQDPNVLVVGEVRDEETAQTVVQAGLSGHLVISTIHSGTSAQVFARLLHMGIEPFLLASAITGVVAQRLVRRLCPACRQPRPLTPVESRIYFSDCDPPPHVFQPSGCPECNQTGYRGRMAVFEIAVPDDALREAVLNRAPTAELHRISVAAGMTPLLRAAAGRLRSGDTSIEEIGRVIA